jgi:hypothetical protein
LKFAFTSQIAMADGFDPDQEVRPFLKGLNVDSPAIQRLREEKGAETVGDIAECLDEKDLYDVGLKKVQVTKVAKRLKLSSGEAASSSAGGSTSNADSSSSSLPPVFLAALGGKRSGGKVELEERLRKALELEVHTICEG